MPLKSILPPPRLFPLIYYHSSAFFSHEKSNIHLKLRFIYLLVQFLLTPKSVACLYCQTQRGSDLVISFRSMLLRCIGTPIITAVSSSARKIFKPKSCTEGPRCQGAWQALSGRSQVQSLLSWGWANSRYNVTIKRNRKKTPTLGWRGEPFKSVTIILYKKSNWLNLIRPL